MPQLEFSTWISQIFWLIVVFVMMYTLMSIFVVPRMQSIFARRKQKIAGDLKRAEELKIEAESILNDYNEQLQVTKQETEEIILNAKNNALKIHDEKIAEFNEENIALTEIAIENIKKSKQEAMDNIDKIVSDIATDSLDKIIGVKVSKKEIEKTIKLVK